MTVQKRTEASVADLEWVAPHRRQALIVFGWPTLRCARRFTAFLAPLAADLCEVFSHYIIHATDYITKRLCAEVIHR